jgi:ribosomal protein S18 acetylase RimI-like enzyme
LREIHFEQDYQAVRDLWSTAGPGIHVRRSDEPDEIRKKLQRDPDLFLVAESNGQVIGTVLGGFDGRRGMVYHLAVRSDFRKNGIGEALMQELERRMKAKGCIKSYLLVVNGNDAAEFYEKRGWEKMDLAIYGKDL